MMTDHTKQDDWPAHTEELSRKTMEELEKWAGWNADGEKSDVAFYLAVGVMWDVTSGLVNKDVSHLLAEIHKELRLKIKKARRQ